jgi:hypothetical protein
MSYDQPKKVTSHGFGAAHAFSAGAAAHAIRVPLGMNFARIEEVSVLATVTFNAVTTPAYVRVGTAADDNKFAELNLATVAATDSRGSKDDTDAVLPAGQFIDLTRGGDSGAALSQLEVAFIANTGGTPAGTGIPTITVSWW